MKTQTNIKTSSQRGRSWADPQGVRHPPPPPENSQNIGFLSNTKSNTGLGPMTGRCLPILWYLDPLTPHQLKKNRSVIKFGPPSDKTFWIRAWRLLAVFARMQLVPKSDVLAQYLLPNQPAAFPCIYVTGTNHECFTICILGHRT